MHSPSMTPEFFTITISKAIPSQIKEILVIQNLCKLSVWSEDDYRDEINNQLHFFSLRK